MARLFSKCNGVSIAGLLLFLSSCVAEPSQASVQAGEEASNSVIVMIDNGREHQTVEGFGATHNSLVYEGKGDVLAPSLRARAIDLVYRQVGITMGNLEGALLESSGGWDQRANDNGDPFTFNWRGFQAFNADAMKKKVLDLARPHGFDNYFLGQKINVRWASPWLDKIRKADYNRYLDEAAEQVAAGQIYWRDTYGIVPKYQMLFNEPLSGNGELLNGTVRDVVEIIKRAGARLRKEGFPDVKFVVPNEETEEKSLNTAEAILSDPEARQYVGAIGYHPYPYGSAYASIPRILSASGTGRPDRSRVAVRNKLRDLGKQYGIPVWMTEVSHGEVNARSFDAVMGRAIHIHDELVYANAAAYFGMNNMWDSTSHELHFGGRGWLKKIRDFILRRAGVSTQNTDSFFEDGNILLIEQSTGTLHLTGIGIAIGHYARWIKRGAIRIEATSSDPLLQVSAFRHNGQKRIVMVIINTASSEKTVHIKLSGATLNGSLAGEQSTAATYWQPLAPQAPSGPADFTYTVPASSVTTLSARVRG